jgi:hypothetical protein
LRDDVGWKCGRCSESDCDNGETTDHRVPRDGVSYNVAALAMNPSYQLDRRSFLRVSALAGATGKRIRSLPISQQGFRSA